MRIALALAAVVIGRCLSVFMVVITSVILFVAVVARGALVVLMWLPRSRVCRVTLIGAKDLSEPCPGVWVCGKGVTLL